MGSLRMIMATGDGTSLKFFFCIIMVTCEVGSLCMITATCEMRNLYIIMVAMVTCDVRSLYDGD